MEEGWGEEPASTLAIEYELARDLLRTYEGA
jgi:hypothetical protein